MIAWSSTKFSLISNKLSGFSQQEKNQNLVLETFWKILGNGKWVAAAIGGEGRNLLGLFLFMTYCLSKVIRTEISIKVN